MEVFKKLNEQGTTIVQVNAQRSVGGLWQTDHPDQGRLDGEVKRDA